MESVRESSTLAKQAEDRSSNSTRSLLFWAVFAAFAVRLIVVAVVYKSFLDPERQHWLFGFEIGKIAESLVQGHGFGNLYYGPPTGPTAQIAPVMPCLMAVIFYVFGIYTKASAIVMLCLNSLFSAATCIPIFFIAKKSFGIRIAKWTTWFWAFFPYAIYFSADSMWDHALVTLLVSCIFLLALSLAESSGTWKWIVFGALGGFGALVNPVVLGILPVLGGWACYRSHRERRHWARPAILSLAVICGVIFPWLVRNYRTFGKPVFVKDDLPLELCVGNVGNSLYWWNGPLHPSGSSAALAEFDRLGEQAFMDQKWAESRDFIERNPGTFVWRSIRRFVYVWTGYWSFNRKYLEEENFDPADIPFRTALTIFALVGLWTVSRRNPAAAVPFVLMLLAFPIPYYLTHPEIAYRTPIDPEMVVLVCSGFLLRRAEERDFEKSVGKEYTGKQDLVPEPEFRS